MDKFSYEANGYNRKEVNQFIGDVIVQTESIIQRVKNQNTEIEKSFFAKLEINGVAVYEDNTEVDNSLLIANKSKYLNALKQLLIK